MTDHIARARKPRGTGLRSKAARRRKTRGRALTDTPSYTPPKTETP